MKRVFAVGSSALLLLVAIAPVTTAPASAVDETCDSKVATIVLPAVSSSWDFTAPVVGTPGDDVIVGSEGRDTIDGGLGDDVICGLGGADELTGGPGNDRLFGGLDSEYVPDELEYIGDLVVPGPGDDYVDLGADQDSRGAICSCDPGYPHWDQVSFAGAPGPMSVDLAAGTATGEGTDVIVVPEPGLSAGIVGSSYSDVLLGSAAKDFIVAGEGNDVVEGREGKDRIVLDGVAAGDDRVDGGLGDDAIDGGAGTDQIEGGEGDDRLSGGPQSTLRGGAGKDRLYGTSGTTLSGGAEDDEFQLELTSRTRSSIDGGSGGNKLWLTLPKSVFAPGLHLKADVPHKRFSINRRKVLDLRGVEFFVIDAPLGRLTFLGSAADEWVLPFHRSRLRVRAFGRGGRDVLRGGRFADMLDGGPGRDVLYGRNSRDRCLNGEEFGSCEVRR
jgi:Ca2+-binding RTX toxin-like protein